MLWNIRRDEEISLFIPCICQNLNIIYTYTLIQDPVRENELSQDFLSGYLIPLKKNKIIHQNGYLFLFSSRDIFGVKHFINSRSQV